MAIRTIKVLLLTAFVSVNVVGCATIIKGTSHQVGINSAPDGATVEIKGSNGIIYQSGLTPFTAKVSKKREYTVKISLEGYQAQEVLIYKDGIEIIAFCNGFGILGWGIDFISGAINKLEPEMINVTLKKVIAFDGGSEIYAFLTVVEEDGKSKYFRIKMVPELIN